MFALFVHQSMQSINEHGEHAQLQDPSVFESQFDFSVGEPGRRLPFI